MSSWPLRSLIPTSGANSFLLIVNPHGEAVMHTLNDEGKAVTFACGKIDEMLGEAVKHARGYRVIRFLNPYDDSPDNPANWLGPWWMETWGELAELLNKRGVQAREARGFWRAFSRLGLPTGDYLDCDDDGRYVPTKKAAAIDAQRAAAKAKAD